MCFSLLVFAQKRSNHVLAALMALSYYIQIIISVIGYGGHIWLGYANPMIRLPVFFMGVCAGVLCIRIQRGDIDAFQSMNMINTIIPNFFATSILATH